MGRGEGRNINHNNKMIESTRSYFFEAVFGIVSLALLLILTMP